MNGRALSLTITDQRQGALPTTLGAWATDRSYSSYFSSSGDAQVGMYSGDASGEFEFSGSAVGHSRGLEPAARTRCWTSPRRCGESGPASRGLRVSRTGRNELE